LAQNAAAIGAVPEALTLMQQGGHFGKIAVEFPHP